MADADDIIAEIGRLISRVDTPSPACDTVLLTDSPIATICEAAARGELGSRTSTGW